MADENKFRYLPETKNIVMISNTTRKLVRSLRLNKYRMQHNLFSVEGTKIVLELIQQHTLGEQKIVQLFAESDWIVRHKKILSSCSINVTQAEPGEIKQISNFKSPSPVIAVAEIPSPPDLHKIPTRESLLGFESLRDPGNLGTIVRTADWFGFRYILCSEDTVDLYNPKVIQSSMGAFLRVRVIYTDLAVYLQNKNHQLDTVFGTYLTGENIYRTSFSPGSFFLFGSESHGISSQLENSIDKKITIPSFASRNQTSESLNIASSMAIVCSEVRRRQVPDSIQNEN